MLAVRWHGRGDVRVEEVPPPAPPGPGELQLQVRWCGICGTDLGEWRSGRDEHRPAQPFLKIGRAHV